LPDGVPVVSTGKGMFMWTKQTTVETQSAQLSGIKRPTLETQSSSLSAWTKKTTVSNKECIAKWTKKTTVGSLETRRVHHKWAKKSIQLGLSLESQSSQLSSLD
jgi:hypothetical protein